eukprot:5700310-Amphidinium_carterae.1
MISRKIVVNCFVSVEMHPYTRVAKLTVFESFELDLYQHAVREQSVLWTTGVGFFLARVRGVWWVACRRGKKQRKEEVSNARQDYPTGPILTSSSPHKVTVLKHSTV